MNNNQDLKDKLAEQYVNIALKHFQYKEVKSEELIELNRQKIKQLLEENERILEEQLKSSKRSAFSDHSKSLRVKGSRESSSSSRSNDSMGKKSITLKFQDFQPDGSVKSKFVNPRLFSIPHVKPIPKYAIWTPIIRNIKTKDDPVLRHLYYFGEGAEHDLDIDFYMDVFDKIDFGSSKFDNDECKKQLQSEIDDRVKEFSPLKEINGKDVSKIFKSLQCLRCYRYNCKLHVTKKLHPAPNPNEEPCKNDCYRYLAEKVDYSEQSLESEWNDEEIALFNESCRLIGTEDYCALAAIIKSKSCKEVYQKSQSVDDIITSSEKDPKLINKKASNRAVIIDNDAYKQAEYNPCYHPGEDCTSAKCSCLKGNLYCEKYCHCEENCERRFQGCKCNYSKDCVCGTKKCPCFENNRECDFDICKCPAGVQCIYNSDTYCKNVMVQQGRSKSTIIGFSTVAGWGLFMREEVRKSEYIGEYIGEIISHAEADRRGKIYDKRRSSFLFNLNIDTVIDATRKGNKLRFINHSNSPNTNCRVVMANGEHHIAIYAAQLIKPGEELFYDYHLQSHRNNNKASRIKTSGSHRNNKEASRIKVSGSHRNNKEASRIKISGSHRNNKKQAALRFQDPTETIKKQAALRFQDPTETIKKQAALRFQDPTKTKSEASCTLFDDQ
ncbi:6313_t:CDS:10 [Entrophospora sp. SA101]|nr:6313_t:CDS:10 [Entrophospora sp. SA101]